MKKLVRLLREVLAHGCWHPPKAVTLPRGGWQYCHQCGAQRRWFLRQPHETPYRGVWLRAAVLRSRGGE